MTMPCSRMRHLKLPWLAFPCSWGRSLLRKSFILLWKEGLTLDYRFRLRLEKRKKTLSLTGTAPLAFSSLRSKWWRSTWSCSSSRKAKTSKILYPHPAITRTGAATTVDPQTWALSTKWAFTPLLKSLLSPLTSSAPSSKNGIPLDFLT